MFKTLDDYKNDKGG